MMRLASVTAAVVFTAVPPARADFAPPPERADWSVDDRRALRDDPYPPWEARGDRSSVRIFTGPGIRFYEGDTSGGLVAAVDVGQDAAGARIGGAWLRAGSNGGSSQYTAELWVDFAEGHRVHPVLAAGGGLARLDRDDDRSDGIESTTVGVGSLRATLQYELPVRAVDARAALDVTGSVPAFGSEAASTPPWITAAVTIGIGF